MSGSVVLATCRTLPEGDEDARMLDAALRARGVTARWQVWDDPDAAWSDTLVVLRSTWDYTDAVARFRTWTRRVPHLANPAEVVAWSLDKSYLLALAESGVPTVPTTLVRPGERFVPPAAAEFVVKPAIGAGSRGAGRFAAPDATAGAAHVAALHADGLPVLVQPYLEHVDAVGETALVYFAGRYSHAIGKGPMLPAGTVHPSHSYALYVPEQITARTPSPAERAVGDLAVDAVRARFGRDLLYLRVDLLPGPHGPLLGELELAEPSLFLGYAAGAADRFAAAITAEAARR